MSISYAAPIARRQARSALLATGLLALPVILAVNLALSVNEPSLAWSIAFNAALIASMLLCHLAWWLWMHSHRLVALEPAGIRYQIRGTERTIPFDQIRSIMHWRFVGIRILVIRDRRRAWIRPGIWIAGWGFEGRDIAMYLQARNIAMIDRSDEVVRG